MEFKFIDLLSEEQRNLLERLKKVGDISSRNNCRSKEKKDINKDNTREQVDEFLKL